MPKSPHPIAEDIVRCLTPALEAGHDFLRDLARLMNAVLAPDPFARTTDPVRHPEGREDPEEYA